MLFFRLWLLCLIFGLGWAALCWVFTRDRRYIRYARRIVLFSAILSVLLVGVRYLERWVY